MRNFVQAGDNITIPAPAAVTSGAGVQVGGLFGVAAGDAEAGANVVIATRGVFDLPKAPTAAFDVGDVVEWDAGQIAAQDTGTAIGHVVAAAGNPSATARVRLGG